MTDTSQALVQPLQESIPQTSEQARVLFGHWLKAARERAGMSVEAVSQETRIGRTYIVNLESGELDSLPGKVFGRGFVKNITRLLNSDQSEALRLYDSCWGQPVSESGHAPSEVTQRLMTPDFAMAGERPRLPSASSIRKILRHVSVLRPWSKVVARPQTMLWVLATCCVAFGSLVLGRWAVHRIRLTPLTEATVVRHAKPEVSKPTPTVTASDLGRLDQDAALAEMARTTAISDDLLVVPPTNHVMETTPSPVTVMPSASTPATFEQILELKIAAETDIHIVIDGKKIEKTRYEMNQYRFTFSNKAELFLSDASQVEMTYNGKSLGVLGFKGRKRRIVFQAKANSDDFPF